MKELVEEILRRKKASPFIIAIGGRGAAGKTRFALELQKSLLGSFLINLDCFYKAVKERRKEGLTGMHPSSVDESALRSVIERIRKKEAFTLPPESVNNEDHLFDREYKPSDIVIIEGLSVFMDPFLDLWDLTIFIDCSEEEELHRRRQREAGRNRPQEELEQIFKERNVHYKEFIEKNKDSAVIILESKLDYSLWHIK